jgi:diguanylate cyclase (GGDEF)-like protein
MCFQKTLKTKGWSLSRVKPHPITGKPSIFMGQPVIDANGKMQAVLLGELRIDLIEQLRRKVRFGEKGHSAIVDQTGHVVAHPNPKWMAEMRDISDWPIVKQMMAGKTGVTTFYSPFIKADMVAGYAAVPGIGWGIMVPQPKSEVAAQVNGLMRSHIIWGLAGLLLAILLAIMIARWITRPLNQLAAAGHNLLANGLRGYLPETKPDAPAEVRELGTTITALVASLQQSRDEVQELNENLQGRVDAATQRLRESNERLEQAARVDYLTALANRRHFETSLSQALSRRRGDVDNVCIMLIDIDHFKQINDFYGHGGGDAVLNHVARILERQMRAEDLVARYGGDEFVAHMRCSHEIGIERAQQIRQTIEQCGIPWKDKTIHITASIGLYCQPIGDKVQVNDLLNHADNAMYDAKQRGRNRVVDMSS